MTVRHSSSERTDAPRIPDRLRVLVVGAGIAGVSVARGLLRDGHDVAVFERRPDMRVGGGAVTIWSHGSTVLDQLGVDMDGAGQLLSTVRIATSTGRRLINIDVSTIVDRLGGAVRMVPRRVLLDRLLDGFPTERVHCNSRVVGAVSTRDGVQVEFEDGTSVVGDLLIGADGLHSKIRTIVGAPPARPTGWCSWQGLKTVPHITESDVAVQIIGPRGNLGLWPAGGSDLQWWFDMPWSTDFVRPHRPIEMLRANFSGWSDLVDNVLAMLTDDDLAPSPFPHFRHPIPRASRIPAVTLLGDAAHTMPPILAQGTNQALLDTMVLRKALSDVPRGSGATTNELTAALRRYEKTRRRRLSAVSWVTSRQISQSESVLKPAAMVSDSFGTTAMTTFMRWLSHRRIAEEFERGRCDHFAT
ncbi:NAD(P)/FAD-dependent oxidoreductase [Mycolicibacterium sp. 120270]|uniref:FAD-dependent oxidoreductase n=1 Tax=Mycolicibacterium sp. 120270 TaxID=3090600 RepID=UPI00299DFB48|nr:NAD(P)/FAD-dependent oxidoreductase [Mycolicibacterium sp. 120270]MDX1886208.1 NAD(P)/FAD-dependent oxidoreductase [Mycolicibacterium sp. 120270]